MTIMAYSTGNYKLITTVFIMISVVSATVEVDFRVTPAVVEPLKTGNVSLQCLVTYRQDYYNQQQSYYFRDPYGRPYTNPPPGTNDVQNIAMIRIVKNFQDRWQSIVQIGNVSPKLVNKLQSSITEVSGLISDDITKRSFLYANWKLATADVFGVYRCDVISFDAAQNAILTTSSQIILGKELDALAFLRLFKHETGGIYDTVDTLNKDMKANQNVTQQLEMDVLKLKDKLSDKETELEIKANNNSDLLKSQGDSFEKRIIDVEREITKKIDGINGNVKFILESGFFMLWPRGSFGLLMPQSGCPSSGLTTWESGSRRHHTESTDRNQDSLSSEIHLKEPVLERVAGNNFVTQRFCIRSDARSLGPAWPRGSYCINKKGECPLLFQEGFIQWDEEDDVDEQKIEGQLPDGEFNESDTTLIEYCCRQDGPTDIPIYLPNSEPFYLYRYGGMCQSVQNMNVTEEFVLFDTENSENKDEFGKIHPDGKINNLRLELCYYTKK